MNDEPDLIVSAQVVVYDIPNVIDIKAMLRRQVEEQLPEGYGEDHGDYAQYTSWRDAKTWGDYYKYEVHI